MPDFLKKLKRKLSPGAKSSSRMLDHPKRGSYTYPNPDKKEKKSRLQSSREAARKIGHKLDRLAKPLDRVTGPVGQKIGQGYEPVRKAGQKLIYKPYKKAIRQYTHRHSFDYQRLASSGEETDRSEDYKYLDKASIRKLPKLSDEESEFFNLVNSGNVSAVEELYDMSSDTCKLIEALNFEGYTVLHIAAARQDEEMVELLCSKFAHCVKPPVLQDVLLHAIHEGNLGIVKQLIAVMDKRGIPRDRPEKESESSIIKPHEIFPNSNFTDDIKCAVLAAQGKSYDLMHLFSLQVENTRDEFEPHKPNCKCRKCGNKNKSVEWSIRQLHSFQAFCNPTFICFIALYDTKIDPVYMAFKLIEQLEETISTKPNFVEELQEILDELKKFSCDLLAQCRNAEEVQTFLKQTAGYEGEGQEFEYYRLAWALDLELKEFVAHPNAQMLLFEEWVRGWPEWRRRGPGWRAFHLLISIFYPFAFFLTFFKQDGPVFGFLASPVKRFLNTVVSYVVFLIMIFCVNIEVSSSEGYRGPPNTGLEIPIIVWTAGHIFMIFRQFLITPTSLFIRSTWVWFDMFNQLMFICAFICWGVATEYEGDKLSIPRKFWRPHEPALVGEMFFAIASIMAYSRLLRLLQLNYKIGPLITAMGSMGRDILEVLIFIGIIGGGYGFGLYYMYRPYHGWHDKDDDGSEVKQNEKFTTMRVVYDTLFFALFAMSGSDSPHIIERHITDPKNKDITSKNKHDFTETTGKLIFASFHLIGTLMAMNMVGGVVISEYDRIRENVDMEWKFVRGQIWMSFIKGNVHAVPLNFLPNCPCCCAKQAYSKTQAKSIKKGDAESGTAQQRRPELNYNYLIRRIVERYVRDKAEVAESERANTDIVTSLREDLSELREAMDKSERLLKKTGIIEIKDKNKDILMSPPRSSDGGGGTSDSTQGPSIYHRDELSPPRPPPEVNSSTDDVRATRSNNIITTSPPKTPSAMSFMDQKSSSAVPPTASNINIRSRPPPAPAPPRGQGQAQVSSSVSKPLVASPGQTDLGTPVPSSGTGKSLPVSMPSRPPDIPKSGPGPAVPSIPSGSSTSTPSIATSAKRRSSDLSRNVRFDQPPGSKPNKRL